VSQDDVRPISGAQWSDPDMARAYLAGYNDAHSEHSPGRVQSRLEDIAEDFGHWLTYDYEPDVRGLDVADQPNTGERCPRLAYHRYGDHCQMCDDRGYISAVSGDEAGDG
jgi:hypothetical protein